MQSDRVGKYRIIAKLGQGGMAAVFLSVVPGPVGFNKLLVVKLLKEDLEQDEDFLAMFLNEARIAARLNHPNVVQTYEVGVEGTHHFLAMDYLDGQPLHGLIRKVGRAKMPLDVHVRILADVLAGLHYAHTLCDFDGTPLGVVHRDVSPQNVFVTYDGQVKLVDFGIAKATGASSTTQSGMFKGKLAYVAPEQAGGETVNARADVFSVGVMLWEAMSGHRFAQGDSQTVVMGRRLTGTEPRIRDVAPTVDPELADICDRAMAHEQKNRFATAREFGDALDGWLERRGKRVGTREVGELVSGLFAEDREKIRKVIDEQMRQLLRETSSVLPVPTIEASPGSVEPTPITTMERQAAAFRAAATLREAASIQDPATESGSGMHPTLIAADISQRRSMPAKPKGRGLIVVLSLLLLASVGGIGFELFLKHPGPAKVGTTADGAGESGDRVKLSITFGPAGAVARLDGVPLAESPFVAQVPRDGSMHRIDVEGPGMKPETKMVSYEKNITVAVALLAAEPQADTAPSASAAALPAAAPVDTNKRLPGGDAPRPKGPKPREIDEKDPYKK